MKLLLVHSQDDLPKSAAHGQWDRIVDCARAPRLTYDRWAEITGARVSSLYDLANRTEDLKWMREMVQAGLGHLVDEQGLDWWDVLSILTTTELFVAVLIHRLAEELAAHSEIYSTRPNLTAKVLAGLVDGRWIDLRTGPPSLTERFAHYGGAFRRLDFAKTVQVVQDKFDSHHRVRRYLTARPRRSKQPVFLLPSAYINVTHTALSYAQMLPEEEFLLVVGRGIAKPSSTSPNVRVASLDGYFAHRSDPLLPKPAAGWDTLRKKLTSQNRVFKIADDLGAIRRIAHLLPWGLALAGAWRRVFERNHIAGCLCADDGNPYSRIPLILAKSYGLPTLACHHGALDFSVAFKSPYADRYLAKGPMERDYIQQFGAAWNTSVEMGAPTPPSTAASRAQSATDRSWIVFFSEPYEVSGLRSEEVYRDLLPRLYDLAVACDFDLVFKLHPFESENFHRQLLSRHLPPSYAKNVRLIQGSISEDLWSRTRIAFTVQSSVAVQCATRGIPVFLCAWLRDLYSGYAEQYAKFGVGRTLDSSQAMADIPRLLREQSERKFDSASVFQPMQPERLRDLLHGKVTDPAM